MSESKKTTLEEIKEGLQTLGSQFNEMTQEMNENEVDRINLEFEKSPDVLQIREKIQSWIMSLELDERATEIAFLTYSEEYNSTSGIYAIPGSPEMERWAKLENKPETITLTKTTSNAEVIKENFIKEQSVTRLRAAQIKDQAFALRAKMKSKETQ